MKQKEQLVLLSLDSTALQLKFWSTLKTLQIHLKTEEKKKKDLCHQHNY